MAAHTLKMAWRHSWKNRGHALLNISGLGLGLAVVILILLYVGFETSYDRNYPLGKRIYRIMVVDLENGGRLPVTPAPLGPALKESFPEVEQCVRMRPMSNVLISANGKHFFEDHFPWSRIDRVLPYGNSQTGPGYPPHALSATQCDSLRS